MEGYSRTAIETAAIVGPFSGPASAPTPAVQPTPAATGASATNEVQTAEEYLRSLENERTGGRASSNRVVRVQPTGPRPPATKADALVADVARELEAATREIAAAREVETSATSLYEQLAADPSAGPPC